MTSAIEAREPDLIPRRRLRAGALAFAVLTAAGLAVVFVAGARRDGSPGLGGLRPGFLLLAVASAFLDVVLGAVRYQVFLRKVRPGSSLWLPIRADLAGRFVGAVTPSQSGGGPAQVFVLHRGGVPVPAALSFLLVNLLATLAFFLLAGGVAAWRLRDHFGTGVLRLLLQYGFGAVLALFALMLVALVRPDLVSRPVAWLAGLFGRGVALRPTALERAARWLAGSLEAYRAACDLFVRRSPWLPVASFAVTILIYLNKFSLAWLVLRGLGVDGGLGQTLALMTLLHLGVFLAPSPGGSGIAEVATGAVMSALVPGPLLGPFTLVYRMLIVYLPAAAGAVVLLGELGRGKPGCRAGDVLDHAASSPRPLTRRSCRVALGLALGLSVAPGIAGRGQRGRPRGARVGRDRGVGGAVLLPAVRAGGARHDAVVAGAGRGGGRRPRGAQPR